MSEWNKKVGIYSSESDLRISLRQLQMFLNDYDDLPLEAVCFFFIENIP
jgi:hypothetical protein